MSELARTEPNQTAIARGADMAHLTSMLEKMVTSGTDPAMAREFFNLYRDMKQESAKAEFAAAFSSLKKDLPEIIAAKRVKNAKGEKLYDFAPIDQIAREIAPAMQKHGFSYRFDREMTEKVITSTCWLTHSSGYSMPTKFAAILSAPPNTSPAQACGATATLADRYALMGALGLAITKDDDARLLGGYITAEDAKELESRLAACGGDVVGFLRLAEAKTFAEIRTGKLGILKQKLTEKEKLKKGGGAADAGAGNVPVINVAAAPESPPTSGATVPTGAPHETNAGEPADLFPVKSGSAGHAGVEGSQAPSAPRRR